jgi:hypothetical protein
MGVTNKVDEESPSLGRCGTSRQKVRTKMQVIKRLGSLADRQRLFHTGPTTIYFAENTKRGSITVQLTSCLDYSVLHIKTKVVSCHTADSKPVKHEVNSTVIHFPL